jgi:tRNA 2-selenouridine synthase
MVWAAPLRAAGFRVDVLGGGWINYRRWVSAGLELLPRVLTFRPLVAPPVSGLCRVLDVLARQGEQVLDLAAMAGQDLVPGLTLQGDEQPAQAAFETALLDAMRRLNPQRPVWIRDGIAGLGGLALPPALRDALRRSKSVTLEVPLQVRALAWFERLQAMNTPMTFLLQAFSASPLPPSSQSLEQWRSLENAGQITDALAAIIKGYIDPRCAGVPHSAKVEVIHLASLKADAVGAAVIDWLGPSSSVVPNGTN